MSWSMKPRLFTLLEELVVVLREHNSLLREAIEAQTKRPARTPLTKTSIRLPPLARATLQRQFGRADVTSTRDGHLRQTEKPAPAPAAEARTTPTSFQDLPDPAMDDSSSVKP